MLQHADYFGEQDLTLIYIAKRLKDAQALERKLTDAGMDYLVEADTYVGGFLFKAERVGAFFYVVDREADRARMVLRENGWRPYQPPANSD